MKLYAYWRSSCSYRARIALGLKGLEVEILPVHLKEGRQSSEEFTAKNPRQQVPVLELDDGAGLAESVAIFEYLEEQHPEPALLPADPILRARCRQLTEIVNSGIQPLQNLYVLRRLKAAGVDPEEWSVHFIRRGLEAYERIASDVAGEFSVGDAPSFADCVLVPQLYNARRFGIDVAAELPTLERIDRACAELDAFAAAHPDRQPDAP